MLATAPNRPLDDLDLVKIELEGVCRTCRHRHKIVADPRSYMQQQLDWLHKHQNCDPDGVLFVSTAREIPRGFDDTLMQQHGRAPWWLDFQPNADVKVAFGTVTALTWGLHSTPLGSSSSLLAGRESTAVNNTSNKYLDYLVAGKVTTGTSPTNATNIEVWGYSSYDDSPTYPDSFTGSDSARSATSRDILFSALRLIQVMVADNNSNRTYWFAPVSVASLFGGVLPSYWGLWGVHNTGVALNSTSSNHFAKHTPMYATVV